MSEMTRRPARFTQAEISRAIRAARNRVVEITPEGSIRILPEGQPAAPKPELDEKREYRL
jgi:hypothetical protein